jgi:hypothetical protein
MPWRPAKGIYLIVERGAESPVVLGDVDGIAGIWWHEGGAQPMPGFADTSGIQVTYCFLDGDPVDTAERLRAPLEQRWAPGRIVPLLAAPFHTIVPFEWDRFLPDTDAHTRKRGADQGNHSQPLSSV